MDIAIMLLVSTLVNSVVKLMTLCLCIFPLTRDTTIHIKASNIKNGVWEGRYDFRLAGFVHIMTRKDTVRNIISANNVIALNLRFSIRI